MAIIGMGRCVIGHQHVGIARAMKALGEGEHVHVAFIGPHFDVVIEAATDVAKVDVEDLLAPGFSSPSAATPQQKLKPW